MNILNYWDDALAMFFGIALMYFALTFMKKSSETGAKNWEEAGFYVFHTGLFLAIAQFILFMRFTIDDNLGMFETLRTIGYIFWTGALYYLYKMSYGVSKGVEDMLF